MLPVLKQKRPLIGYLWRCILLLRMEDTNFSSGQKFWECQRDVLAYYSCGVWCEITSLLYGKYASLRGMYKDSATGWIIRHENLPWFKKLRSEFQRRAWLLKLRVSKQIRSSSHLVIYLVNWWRHSKEIILWTTSPTNPKHTSEILVLLFRILPRSKKQETRISCRYKHFLYLYRQLNFSSLSDIVRTSAPSNVAFHSYSKLYSHMHVPRGSLIVILGKPI